MKALRICLLVHSTLPRGGVMHAIELGSALARAGHAVDICAPDATGTGLCRTPGPGCRFVPVAARATPRDLRRHVQQRIDEWLTHFITVPGARDYDIYHSQDSISANALATLTERGAIGGYYRTVHHLDRFDDAQLTAWQTRGFMAAQHVICVSDLWRDILLRHYGLHAARADNGIRAERFAQVPAAASRELAARLGWPPATGPVFLSIGGIEPRKNTIQALAAFARVRTHCPDARWIIAGGASLLDHGSYVDRFRDALAGHGFDADSVTADTPAQAQSGADTVIRILGPLDDSVIPALYHRADALLFPSVREGFGLAVLEALASGTPVVTSRIAPFTAYLTNEVEWCDPDDPDSIAAALRRAIGDLPPTIPRDARTAAGQQLCNRFTWEAAAVAHEAVYARAGSRAHLSLEDSHA